MNKLLAAVIPLLLLNSCVFEAPFEATAKIPTDAKLLGRWEEVREKADGTPDRMLVLQHSANEYVVEYPVDEKAMYFRAYAVELEGTRYVQIQLLGSAEGPVKSEDRKYDLLKVAVDGDTLEMSTINPEVIGKDAKDTAHLRAAFAKHKKDAKLFNETVKFKRIK